MGTSGKTSLGALDTIVDSGPSIPDGDDLNRGERVGRFVLLDVLGSGGMGVVYSAYDPQLDRKVAIKLLKASMREGHADAGTRLLREAQAMAKINHPNVIKVHDVGTFHDQVYIAMEFGDGGTVREWLESGKRTIDEILDVFRQAGRGLAAAHAAGLVHRDFKPDNVLLVSDGSVRVTDFGLVGLASGVDITPEPPIASANRITPLSENLTRTGALMGTPTYMAPEQFSGGAPTEKADQFSFCVSLYEALYRQRPFSGSSFLELSAKVVLGEIETPAGVRVPSWLRRVVLRGLAVEPADRYPTMPALLAALEPKRRRWQAAAALGAAALALAAVVVFRSNGVEPCRGGDDRVAHVWNPEVRATMQAAFDASKRPHAAATFAKLAGLLDGWTDKWQAGYLDACEATRVRAEQSERLLDLRMQCLTRRLDEANATITLLGAGGGDAVDHALDAVRALPPLEACADTVGLTSTVAAPADPAIGSRVAAVRGKLDDARGELRLGRYKQARDAAKLALADAKATGYAPVVAEALLALGRAEKELADKACFEHLRTAMHTATEAGDDLTSLAASTTLVAALATETVQFDVAHEVADMAEATAHRVHLKGAPMVELLDAMGSLEYKQDHNTEAQARFEAAITIADRELPPDDPAMFSSQQGLASMANTMGRYDEAVTRFLRIVTMAERVFGKEHPRVAQALNNLGIAYRNAGRLDDAKKAHDRALAIRIAALGPDHPDVGESYNSLGSFYLDSGDIENAQIYYEKALALWEKTYGDTSAEIAPAVTNLGNVMLDRGDVAKARALFERAIALEEPAYGADDPRVAMAVSNLGNVAMQEHKLDEALALYQRADRIAEKAFGPDHPDVADYLLNISTVYKAQKKLEDAEAIHRQVLRVMEKAYGTEHPRVAMALANYGNIQQEADDYVGALASYQRSLAIFETKLKKDHPYTSYALLGVGGCLIALKRSGEAVPYLERALEIRVAAKMQPDLVAEPRYALARALDHGPRAIELASTALAEYERAGNTDSVAIVKKWLAEHR